MQTAMDTGGPGGSEVATGVGSHLHDLAPAPPTPNELAAPNKAPDENLYGDSLPAEDPRLQNEPSLGQDVVKAPPGSPHGSAPGSVVGLPTSNRRHGRGQGDVGAPPLFEDCYPPRREDEVRSLRRQRDQLYQLELLRQIEEKRRLRQQRRREDIRADLQRLGRESYDDRYLRQLQEEQQQQLRQQLQQQLHNEEQREQQRMRQLEETRQLQRQLFHEKQQRGDPVPTGATTLQDRQVEQLGEQLQKQHLSDDACPEAESGTEQLGHPEDEQGGQHQQRPPSRAEAKPRGAPPGAPQQGAGKQQHKTPNAQDDEDDISAGVVDQVRLDDQRPWNHYRALQRELKKRRLERAAVQAAREAAARRHAEINERARMDGDYRRYLDWRQRVRRVGRVEAEAETVSPRRDAARRWADRQRSAFLQQRADRDAHLAEWRSAKDAEKRERKQAAQAAQRAAQEAAQEKQHRAHDSFTRWLATIHERKLAERAGPVGATGVTTYESFHAAPWNKILRARRKSVA